MSRVSLLLAALLCVSFSRAQAEMIVFGDSLSDTGNLFLATGGTAGPLFSPTPLMPGDPLFNPALPVPRFPTPPYNGTASNGPIWIQQFASGIGKPAPTPSLAGGRNYAFIAATTGPQTPSFFPGVPDMQMQVQSYLASNTPASNELFVVWGGSNDYFFGQVNPAIPVGNISTIISDLHAAGAKRFIVPNLTPLGATPTGMATDPVGLNFLTATHNALLSAELASLRQSLDANIIELDVATGFQDILADPAAFGLTNTTGTALDVVDDPMNPLFGFPEFPTSVVPNPDEFLFFDGVHPTTVGHGFIAQTALAAVPEPSSIFVWSLISVGLAGFGYYRIRRKK